MGGVELHPAVQRLADKADPTMEERAIVGLMRTHLEITLEHHASILKWLQEANPLGLRGPALRIWAEVISDWILPTQLRRHDAATQRIFKENDQPEHQGDAGRGTSSEASGSSSDASGGQSEASLPIPTSRR